MKFIKLKNFLVYLFLFLLPWQTRLILRAGELNGGYWEYGTISVYATEIILWLALILQAITLIQKRENFQFSIFNFQFRNKIILYSIFYILYSWIFALRKDIHFYYLLHFAEGLGLYFLIRSVNHKKAIWAFIFGMIPQAVLGIWQFLNQSSFASKWLGTAVHDPATLGTFVIETASGRWLRAYGGLPHPNILGGYLAIALLLLADFRFQISDFRFKNLLLVTRFLLLVIFVTALFFTFSRSAWLALAVGFVVMLSRPRQHKQSLIDVSLRQRRVREIFQGILVCAVIFIVLALVFRGPFTSRLQSEERLEVKSQVERISGYKEAWEIFKKHPIAGVGLGNYTYAAWKEIDSSRPSYLYQPVHNIFVLLLVEIGILGVLLISALLLYAIFKNPLIHNSLFIILIFLVLGLFDHYLLSLYPGIILTATALISFPSKLKI